ncbi:class I SAM-dependent methyltransferase [Methanomethylovorans hollandica]|nr:class I SAM-dependent methyltransferase [Methanomethylovorans hollandica]
MDDKMNHNEPGVDKKDLNRQQQHWESVFSCNESMFGEEPSSPAQWAAQLFKDEGKIKILELGAGQGRDTFYFARNGFEVFALDYCEKGVEYIKARAVNEHLRGSIKTLVHDVRKRLPFEDATFDACFSHMLYCMPLKISELRALSSEIKRVLRPGGLNVFTTRHTQDPQYRTGIHISEDMWEIQGGFIVHFLSREKIAFISEGYITEDITEFEEGLLPKRLYRVALRKND